MINILRNNKDDEGVLVFFEYEGEKRIMVMQEGTGDNLEPEDIEDGYVDYINLTMYVYDGACEIEELDGGMRLTTELVQDSPNGLLDYVGKCIEYWDINPDMIDAFVF